MTISKTKCFHFQDIDKWHGEWNKPCNMNVACKAFVECLDHL
jgi:hypothetical protein